MYILFLKAFLMALVIELFYFQLARRFNIVDNPNQRSSHSKSTITGAGVVFPLNFMISLTLSGEYAYYWPLILGVFMISFISFIDDMKALDNRSRIVVHVIAVSLLLLQSSLFYLKIWILLPGFILVVGIINGYNFMDGINGITALYSLVTTATIFYLSRTGFRLPSATIFISLLASIAVFSFFNVRRKTKCFSGDVGSISIAYILSFLIIQLMLQDDNLKWILLIGVYGIDSAGTIILRLIRKENILKAHRTHFYQYLVSDKQLPHVTVSVEYAVVQLILNYVIITQSNFVVYLFYTLLIILYSMLRLRMEGAERLLKSKG